MAPLPKRRISSARSRKRRSQLRVVKKTLVVCSNCGAKKLSHQVCPSCKTYAAKK
ncbi:MAG: 50S ribosomal protein L32 [Candidatus Pacebacteria bacterium]|nr:50S ribosomal protein L32 [Candidatus Paceibacterota bacterium]